jgi:hypothetical protein
MPAARIRKDPATRRTARTGMRADTQDDTSAANTGTNIMTGNVPKTNPSITIAPSAPLPVMAAAASADARVMQGSKAVTIPKTKKPNTPQLCTREILASSREIAVVRILGAQVTSRFISKNHPWAISMEANNTVTATPAWGSIRDKRSAKVPDNSPTAAPAPTYDNMRPRLYSVVANHVCWRALFGRASFAQTRGPHMTPQCQDITKLNQVTASIAPTSNTSMVWSKCSK